MTDLDRYILKHWRAINNRRAKLMNLEEASTIADCEKRELDFLQAVADRRVDLVQLVHMEGMDEMIADLKRRGLWDDTP